MDLMVTASNEFDFSQSQFLKSFILRNGWFLNRVLRYCQICSHGFNSGVYGGIFYKWMFSGISIFFVEWNPALSITTILYSSGLCFERAFRYAANISVQTPFISHTNESPSMGE